MTLRAGLVVLALLLVGCGGRGNRGGARFAGLFARVVAAVVVRAIDKAVAEEHTRRPRPVERVPENRLPPNPMYAMPDPAPVRPASRSFDAASARAQLEAIDPTACRPSGLPKGYLRAKAALRPDGHVAWTQIEQPAKLSPEAAQCVQALLSEVTVPPFDGDTMVVSRTWYVGARGAP